MPTSRPPRAAVLGLTVGALVAGGLVLAPTASAASTTIVINEVYGGGGNSGATLKNDFIELKNVGTAPVDVTGWSVQYASAGGGYTSANKTSLTGVIAAHSTYLVQEAAGTGGTTDLPSPNATGTIGMGGTAGKVALVDSGTTLTCGTACAGSAGVIDLVGYGTTAVGGEGAPTGNLSGSTSASRKSDKDTDDNATDFAVGAPTPENGTVIHNPPPNNCPDDRTILIGTVQGSGPASPCVGEKVTVAGTVVGDLQDGGFGGFFVQDDGDQKPDTSDGIFVFSNYAVARGQHVTVEGTVTEYNGLTELTKAFVTHDGQGTLPAPATLPLPSTDAQREALEGMLVAPASDLTVSEVYNLNRYGEITLAQGGRLITPTETVDPGPAAAAAMQANAERSLLLDDGRTANLSTSGEAPPYLTVDDPVRVGDTAQLEPVVLSYGFDAWRLEPADGTPEGTTFAATNARPAAPGAVGGDLRIADFNVLNYFVDFPSEFGDRARGASDAAELAQQQAKEVTAITALDADIITLHEIENSAVLTPETPYRALETLVAALNEAQGKNIWRYVEAHEASDVITNAIIYRTSAAHPVGDPVKPAEDAVWDNAREPIAQTFRSRGEVFTVVANHLKSKGSSCGKGSDDPSVGGAGNCNGDRVAQAQALVAFAHQVAEDAGDPDVIMTGDYNSYRQEDPIDTILAGGFQEVWTPGEYSYVFQGGSGSLDHVFATPSMFAKVTGHTIWDINAVESFAYEYDGYEPLYAPYAYRASDHNPTLIGVDTKAGTPAAGHPGR